jgi:hypothetical protein
MRRQYTGLVADVVVSRQSVNPASMATNTGSTLNVTVPGVALGDIVNAAPGISLAGIVFSTYVSAANTVTVSFQNVTGGTLDIAAATWTFVVERISSNT